LNVIHKHLSDRPVEVPKPISGPRVNIRMGLKKSNKSNNNGERHLVALSWQQGLNGDPYFPKSRSQSIETAALGLRRI
jgi:hypothetical protein